MCWLLGLSVLQQEKKESDQYLTTSMSDGEEMELRELSFTHFWNGYPLLPSFHLPAGKQLFPRCFLPCFDASRLDPTLPTLSRKHTAGSCGLSTKRMVHVSHSAGTRGVPGEGKPPHFCLERRRIVCVNPRSIRLPAFSRPLSRCSSCRTACLC